MTTPNEIQRRVEQADTARSARRSAAAMQVGELAHRREVIAEQLRDIERLLGRVLAGAQDVVNIEELARFTDVPAADLTRWLAARPARKTTRTTRPRPTTGGPDAPMTAHRTPSSSRTPSADPPTAPSGPPGAAVDVAAAPGGPRP